MPIIECLDSWDYGAWHKLLKSPTPRLKILVQKPIISLCRAPFVGKNLAVSETNSSIQLKDRVLTHQENQSEWTNLL